MTSTVRWLDMARALDSLVILTGLFASFSEHGAAFSSNYASFGLRVFVTVFQLFIWLVSDLAEEVVSL